MTSLNIELTRFDRRKRAAPHIKTYIRFSDPSMEHIEWAMVTSANLSTQAWGAASSASGEVRICSYEIGVVVWPALWNSLADNENAARMIPVFGQDTPDVRNQEKGNNRPCSDPETHLGPGLKPLGACKSQHGKKAESRACETVVGWRMPYDLPLVPYERDQMPWCASEPCNEPDWMGRIWPG